MSQAPNHEARRKPALLLLTSVLLLLGIAYAAYWGLHGRHRESTDDAYVAGNQIRVTPRQAGTVVAVYAEDTDLVRQGQLLVRLDDADARVALARAEAGLAEAVRQVRQMFSAADQARANLAVKEENLRQARVDAERRKGAAGEEAVSREDEEHARSALTRAQAEQRLAAGELEGALARVAHTDVAHHPAVLQAEAQVREAFLALQRCAIRAPETGYVAKRAAQVGQEVAPGAPLMAVIPLQQLWVEANFKEDQLQRMRIGQPVELVSDIYGGDVTFHGRVTGLSAGTGSVFSLLPPQNATGNWIKIVQRLPVRIALRADELAKTPLRLGLSLRAVVETRDTRGPVLAATPPSGPRYQTKVFDPDEAEADRRIRAIVAANLGHKGA